MCIGIPLQIIEQREFTARCVGSNGEKVIETLLIGPQPVGTWVLDFMGTAREVLTEEQARQIAAALAMVDELMQGKEGVDIDAPFADLLDPSRPPGGFDIKKHGG